MKTALIFIGLKLAEILGVVIVLFIFYRLAVLIPIRVWEIILIIIQACGYTLMGIIFIMMIVGVVKKNIEWAKKLGGGKLKKTNNRLA